MKYLDSNVFIYPILYGDKKANSCKEILLKVAKNEMKACTSILSWDEVVFVVKKFRGKEIAAIEGSKLLRMPNLIFLKVDEPIIFKAQEIVSKYHLNPRDAIHAASAISSNCNEIISDDSNFDIIPEIKRVIIK